MRRENVNTAVGKTRDMLDPHKFKAEATKPVRSSIYQGPITDPSRWQDFAPRPGDIFICAPAKSGTTWTQAICAMLIFGSAEIEVAPAKISPWFDTNLIPEETVAAMIEAQGHRRSFKTHTPLDGIPFYPQCNYLAVYRDPRDSFLSLMRLAKKTQGDRGAAGPGSDLHETFRMWMREPFSPGVAEQFSLAAVAHHFNGFWKFRSLPNIHLVHFCDMKRDLPAAIRAIAAALGIRVEDALVERIAVAAGFSNMRQKADQFAPDIGRGSWKDHGDFFHRGENDRWKAFLTHAELAEYLLGLNRLVPGDGAAWLERGSRAV